MSGERDGNVGAGAETGGDGLVIRRLIRGKALSEVDASIRPLASSEDMSGSTFSANFPSAGEAIERC